MRTTSKPRGLTLIEIIFSIAILGTVITLAYGSALAAWRSAIVANQRTQAQYLLQKAVENIKGYRDSVAASPAFNWQEFIVNYVGASPDGFVVDLDCSMPPCKFVPKTGTDVWQAAGQTTMLQDPTQYTIQIQPVDEWTVNPSTLLTEGPKTFNKDDAAQMSAFSVVATVTYTDANGIVSNAQVSTQFARRDQ